MSIENGHLRYKRYMKQDDDSYKLVSHWTSSDSVEMDNGKTLQETMDDFIVTTTDDTLVGSKEGGLKLVELAGNTEQKQLSGVNLYNVNNPVGGQFEGTVDENDWITVTYDNSSGTELHYSNVWTRPTDLLKVSTDYKIILEVKSSSNCTLKINQDNKSQFVTELNAGAVGTYAYTATTADNFDSSETMIRTWVNVQAGQSGSITFRISILEDTTVTADTFLYEEYCGGAPIPNPQYPQSINNTGDCVEMVQGYYDTDNGVYNPKFNTVCTKNAIPCSKNDIITIKTEQALKYRMIYFLDNVFVSAEKIDNNVTEASFTVPSGVNMFKIHLMCDTTITPSTSGKIQLTVNGKYITQFKEHGKNFCSLGTKKVNEYNRYENDILIPPGTYTISAVIESTYTGSDGYMLTFYSVDENNNPDNINVTFKGLGIRTSKTVTLTKPYKSIRLCSANGTVASAGYTSTWTDIQIEPGEVATEYEPYTESIYTIYTNEPIRRKDRIIKKDGLWQVERNVRHKVYNGTEVFATYSNAEYLAFQTLLKEMKLDSRANGLCSHFTPQRTPSNSEIDGITFGSGNSNITFTFSSERFSSVEEFTTWLGENNVEIQYPLANPTYEILDTASQLALNALKTFNGVTYIEIDSRVQSESVKWEYGTTETSALLLKNDNEDLITKTNLENTKASKEEVNDIREDVRALQDAIITTNETTLVNSKEGGLKLISMEGGTQQKQLSGKNLLSSLKSEYASSLLVGETKTTGGITFIRNKDYSVTVSGTSTGANVFVNLNHVNDITLSIPPGDYIVSGGSSSVLVQIMCNGNVLVYSNGNDVNFTIPEDAMSSWCRIRIVSSNITVNETIYPMIRPASIEDNTYEEYCGGQPSPNQQFPQSINNTGDCVEMVQGTLSGGVYIYDTYRVCSKNHIPCQKGDVIKIITESEFTVISIQFYNADKYVTSTSITGNTLEFTVSNNYYTSFRFVLGKDERIAPSTVGKIQLTVNGKYVTQFVEHGKNWFNERDCEKGFISANGTLTVNSVYKLSKFYPMIDGVLSWGSDSTGYIYEIYYDENMNFIKRNAILTTSYKNFPIKCEGATYFRIGISTGGESGTAYSKNVQVEEGTVATEYEPYTESIHTIYTNEPIRKGDVILKKDGLWQVERNRIREILNENKTWNAHIHANNRFFTNLDKKTTGRTVSDAVCSHFLYNYNTYLDAKDDVAFCTDSEAVYIRFGSNSEINTLDLFNAWIAENPIEVEYTPLTPTYEILDDQSQLELNRLQTFDSITYIEIDSRVQPTEITTKYGITETSALALQAHNNMGMTNNTEEYSLPSAGTELGGVKTGGDVTISDGIITVKDDSHNHIISNVDGLQSALDKKVPTTRTINGKALSSNITLSASDVGADASGSADTALSNAKTYTDGKIDALVGEGASTTLDTIGEIAQAIEEHQDVTDAINAAIGNKQATITGAATTVTSSNLTANRALISNSSGKIAVSAVTSTELGYLDGVTSNIQTQLNAKAKGSSKSATTAATADWYRIATSKSGINRNIGMFEVEATVTGAHTTAIITAGTMYGNANSSNVQVLHCSHYSGAALTKARIVYHTVSSENFAFLEVYNPNAKALSITVKLIGGTGWSLVAPSTTGIIPSGYSNKEVTLSNNTMVAGTFKGALSGNADSATIATRVDVGSGSSDVERNIVVTNPDSSSQNLFMVSGVTANYSKGTLTASGGFIGNSSSATKLTTSDGSATKPVYFSEGKPVACTHTLSKSVPSDAVFTDSNVKQSTSTTSSYRALLMSTSHSATLSDLEAAETGQLYKNTNIVARPSTGEIKATKFTGALNGTATKATQDSAGQQINTTYIKALSVSGKVITYTKGDGTTGTITTQDTNTTYSAMTAATSSAAGKAGLVPAPAAGKEASFLRGDGTWATPTNTTYSNFVKSGSGAKAGLVPAPSTTAGTTKYLREDGTWVVPPNTDTKVTISANAPTTETRYYPTMHTSTSGTTAVTANADVRYTVITGTESAVGCRKLVLGNSTASGTAGNAKGEITLYSENKSFHKLLPSSTSEAIEHTLPATTGTILNSGTTSFTASLTSGTKIGTIKINGTSTDIYCQTNSDTKVKITANAPTSATTYYPLMHTSTSATTAVTANTGAVYKNLTGTTSANGYNILQLGNSTETGTAGNSYGKVRLYSKNSYYSDIACGTLSAHREVLLPNKSGTLALTSDIPSGASIAFTQLYSDSTLTIRNCGKMFIAQCLGCTFNMLYTQLETVFENYGDPSDNAIIPVHIYQTVSLDNGAYMGEVTLGTASRSALCIYYKTYMSAPSALTSGSTYAIVGTLVWTTA